MVDYFRKLLNPKTETASTGDVNSGNIEQAVARHARTLASTRSKRLISLSELNNKIAKLKMNKASGWDLVSAEHLKYSGPKCRKWLLIMLNSFLDTEQIPPNLKRGVIVQIPKNGKDCLVKENNRGITNYLLGPMWIEFLLKVNYEFCFFASFDYFALTN